MLLDYLVGTFRAASADRDYVIVWLTGNSAGFAPFRMRRCSFRLAETVPL
jgi:hypothetical protein